VEEAQVDPPDDNLTIRDPHTSCDHLTTMRFDQLRRYRENFSTIIALGVPAIILVVVVETSGVAGAVALLAALGVVGGPLGLFGGVVAIGGLFLISKKIGEVGFDAVLRMVLKGIKESGKTKAQVIAEVESYPIPDHLKWTVRGWVEELWMD